MKPKNKEDEKIKKILYDSILKCCDGSNIELNELLHFTSEIGCSLAELIQLITIINNYPNYKLQNILNLLKNAQKCNIPMYEILYVLELLELSEAGNASLIDLYPAQSYYEAISFIFNYIGYAKNKNIISYLNIFKGIPVVGIICDYLIPPQCIGGYG